MREIFWFLILGKFNNPHSLFFTHLFCAEVFLLFLIISHESISNDEILNYFDL